MIHFKIAAHDNLPDVEVVEVWRDDTMVATIYPQQPDSLRIFSFYLDCVGYETKPVGDMIPSGYRMQFGKRQTP